jgi:O-glycosyl hydrolase/fibronectin type 3 domain-containing protein
MSSWSPPAYLKSNGEVGNGGTLIQIEGQYDYAGFADYWYSSLQDYMAHGVNPTWITIQNEPDWTADYDSCRFDPTEGQYAGYGLAQDAVYNRLQSMASPPKLLGPDCVGLYGNAAGLRNYMDHMNAATFYGIAHHLYGGSTDGTPDGYNSAFTTVLNYSNTLFPGKPRFMTEFGDIKGLIPCANLIHNTLVVEQVSGYSHWSLMWPGDIGLVEIEFPWGSGDWISPKGYWLNPSYWSMKHYSYFIEPGFRRVSASSGNSDILVSSFLSPDSKRLVTVLINRSTVNPAYVTLNPGSFTYDTSNVYQTAGEDHFVSLGPVVGSQVTLPASSLTTIILDHYGPLPPTGLSATIIVDSQVNLTWTPSPGSPTYNVKRSAISGGPYTTIGTTITGTSFSDTTVASGQTYYYVVSADTPGGESPNSAEATPSRVRTYLKFNESGGTTASDATGSGRNGTLYNGPAWGTGKFGNAVYLDGSNDYVGFSPGVVNGLTDFTISAWVYLNAVSTWSRLFDFGTGTSVNMFLTPRHSSTSGTVRFAITTGGAGGEQRINGTAALPAGLWTHVAVTLNGNTGILYVNGAEVGRNSSMTLTPSSLGSTTQNYIGRSQYSADAYLNGRVDEFRIYASALSAAQVAALYAEQIPAAIPPVPTGLSAAGVSGSRIDLTWNGSADAANYNIKRSTAAGGPYTHVSSAGGTSFSDEGLPELTPFYYVISAVNSVGQSADSAQAGAMTQSAPPAAPSGLTATPGNGLVTLDWEANAESDLAGYNIYRSETSGSGYAQINESLLNSPGFVDDNVTNYTTYYYVVTAVDTYAYESDYSDQAQAMPTDPGIIQLSTADFESGWGDWMNLSGEDSHDWTRNSGGTLTPNTGPSGGAGGSAWYVYLETSPGGANVAGNTAILQSPVIPGVGRVLTFYYHMYGIEIGTLNVDVYDGVWHQAVWTLSGQQHSSESQAYTRALVDLTGFTGPIRIRFRAVAVGGPRGDMAIDNIEVAGGLLYGDMNGDNIVNADDLSEFAGYWLLEDCGLDVNGDCLINLDEFAEFAGNWLDDSFQ